MMKKAIEQELKRLYLDKSTDPHHGLEVIKACTSQAALFIDGDITIYQSLSLLMFLKTLNPGDATFAGNKNISELIKNYETW
jgi:hypothetical protein